MPDRIEDLFESICFKNNLSSYDPYDIWKTGIGIRVKILFNNNRILGSGPSLIFSLIDQLINNKIRLGYKKQEYPIVRAIAAQVLLHKYEKSNNKSFLIHAKNHLEWLKENSSKGYSGFCWGLGFKWPAAPKVIYDANTPHATHTPYALEAFHLYTKLSGNNEFLDVIKSCYQFYEKDLIVMFEDENIMATSYGPYKDRIVTNAVSYVMYSYAIFLNYFPEKNEYILTKIQKLFQFIKHKQRPDGSWLYIPDISNSFIDCFHSCFILKNILKTEKISKNINAQLVIEKGFNYVCKNFYDDKSGLYKRFTESNKLNLVKFDLYDNAEMLNLFQIFGDISRYNKLNTAIEKNFIRKNDIYSMIDFLGIRRNKNTLRWAVMPYLLSLTNFE